MKWPKAQTIIDWRKSGRMRKYDEIFWEGDKRTYDCWLSMVIERIKKNDKTYIEETGSAKVSKKRPR